jgi:molecular chaperone DnaJ
MAKDYYGILGVSKGASAADIKAAYRKVVKECHPDKIQDPDRKKEMEAKFKDAAEAYEILSDPQKRRINDMGVPPRWQAGNRYTTNYTVNFGNGMGGGFSFIFGGIQQDPPLEISISVTLEELHSGTGVPTTYTRMKMCDCCSGVGYLNVDDIEPCHQCHGTGRLNFGGMTINSPCQSCGGSGKMVRNPCSKCSGRGGEQKVENAEVRVEKGMRPDAVLMVAGKGSYSPKTKGCGDVYIHLKVKPHEFFFVSFPDVRCVIPITYGTAAAGGSVRVPTLDGICNLAIPAGTSHGTVLRMGGKGLQVDVNSRHRGGQMVVVEIEVPKASGEFVSAFEDMEKKLDHVKVRKYLEYVNGMS